MALSACPWSCKARVGAPNSAARVWRTWKLRMGLVTDISKASAKDAGGSILDLGRILVLCRLRISARVGSCHVLCGL